MLFVQAEASLTLCTIFMELNFHRGFVVIFNLENVLSVIDKVENKCILCYQLEYYTELHLLSIFRESTRSLLA